MFIYYRIGRAVNGCWSGELSSLLLLRVGDCYVSGIANYLPPPLLSPLRPQFRDTLVQLCRECGDGVGS